MSSSSISSSSAKRSHAVMLGGKEGAESEYDCELVIANPLSFQTLVHILEKLLSTAFLKVVKTEEFSGITVSAMDSSKMCMLIGRYACTVNGDNPHGFSLDMKTFRMLLKNVHPHHVLRIAVPRAGAHVKVISYGEGDTHNFIEHTLTTLQDDEEEERGVVNISNAYTLEISLKVLKQVTDDAKALSADFITFTIAVPSGELPEGVRCFFVQLSCANECGAKASYNLMCRTSEEMTDGVAAYRVVSTDDELNGELGDAPRTQVLSESFNADYLVSLVGKMDGETVRLSLASAKPLIVQTQLGCARSYLRVLLAPRCVEED